MEKWRYRSLKWLHKVREEAYNDTKSLLPEELIEKTRTATKDVVKQMGLKVITARGVSDSSYKKS